MDDLSGAPARLPAAPGHRAALPALAILLLSCMAGCGWFGGGTKVIARIAGEPVTQEDFDRYVEETLLDDAAAGGEKPADQLLSRLLDRYLDEELIIREAQRQGLQATEEEIAEATQFRSHGAGATAGVEGAEERARNAARRAVLLRKFREEVVLSGVEVSDEEIAAYYDTHRDKFRQSSQLILRQILLDDEDQARKLREELWKDPNKFEAAAEELSLAPDGGRPTAYHSANLPPEILEAVEAVGEGEISRVAKSPGGFRIFLVEKREAAREVTREEAAGRIGVLLMQEKSRQATEEMLAALRSEAGLVILEQNLRFTYDK